MKTIGRLSFPEKIAIMLVSAVIVLCLMLVLPGCAHVSERPGGGLDTYVEAGPIKATVEVDAAGALDSIAIRTPPGVVPDGCQFTIDTVTGEDGDGWILIDRVDTSPQGVAPD